MGIWFPALQDLHLQLLLANIFVKENVLLWCSYPDVEMSVHP